MKPSLASRQTKSKTHKNNHMALMTNYECLTLVQFRSHIVDN